GTRRGHPGRCLVGRGSPRSASDGLAQGGRRESDCRDLGRYGRALCNDGAIRAVRQPSPGSLFCRDLVDDSNAIALLLLTFRSQAVGLVLLRLRHYSTITTVHGAWLLTWSAVPPS